MQVTAAAFGINEQFKLRFFFFFVFFKNLIGSKLEQ